MSVLGVNGAMRLVRTRVGRRVESRALRGQDIAIQLHETAPRGGANVNRYGEPRSAPGEPPAIETGDLLESMRDGYQYDASTLTASFIANYVVQEYGYDVGDRSRISDKQSLAAGRMDPRPMGRLTIEQLKQEAASGS